jgi:hypothetical protein
LKFSRKSKAKQRNIRRWVKCFAEKEKGRYFCQQTAWPVSPSASTQSHLLTTAHQQPTALVPAFQSSIICIFSHSIS